MRRQSRGWTPARGSAISDAALLDELLDAWSRLPRRAPAPQIDIEGWVAAMSGMAAARDRVVASGAWTAGPSTLMGVLDLSRAEVQNCKVLRWLLAGSRALVFLTVPGERIPATATEPDRWRPLAWIWLADQVHDLIEAAPATANPRALDARRAAADWVAGARRHLT